MERCKKIKMMREEAQELAELDVNNIISTQGNMLYGELMGREITLVELICLIDLTFATVYSLLLKIISALMLGPTHEYSCLRST